jgi:hypothetical protein
MGLSMLNPVEDLGPSGSGPISTAIVILIETPLDRPRCDLWLDQIVTSRDSGLYRGQGRDGESGSHGNPLSSPGYGSASLELSKASLPSVV